VTKNVVWVKKLEPLLSKEKLPEMVNHALLTQKLDLVKLENAVIMNGTIAHVGEIHIASCSMAENLILMSKEIKWLFNMDITELLKLKLKFIMVNMVSWPQTLQFMS